MLFWMNLFIFRIYPVIFRTNPNIIRTNPVVFWTNPVLFRTNPVICRKNHSSTRQIKVQRHQSNIISHLIDCLPLKQGLISQTSLISNYDHDRIRRLSLVFIWRLSPVFIWRSYSRLFFCQTSSRGLPSGWPNKAYLSNYI